MVPATQRERRQRPHYIRHDIVDVECAAVGNDMLQDLGSDAQESGADEEGEVEIPAPRGVENPVETGGEDEECEAVEDFVVDVAFGLEGS